MFCQLPCKRTLLPPVRITSVWATSKPTVALFTASHHFVCVLSGLRVWWFEFRGDLNCDLFVGPRDFSVYPTLVPFQMTTPGKPFNANFLFCFVSILPLLYFHSPNQMNSMSSMSQSQLIASISAIVQQQVTAAMQTIATANSSVANPALPPAAIECTTPLVSNGLSRSNSLGSSTSALTRSGSTMSSVANPALPPAAIEFTTPLVSNGLSRSNSLGSSTSALTRSGSTMSTESSSSTSSQKGYQSFIVDSETEEEEEQQPRKKRMRRLRRRRSTDQRNDDRKQISRAVLTELDNIYLAPRHSKLFRRVFKKARNPDGTRSYKQNADIDMPLFRSLVRPILRRVLGNAVATDRHLAMRYYHAALSVVKKRRANHVQEWRLKGESKPLIYGGRKELFPSRYEPLPTYTHTLITHTHSLTHLPTHRTQSNASASAAAAACIAARDSSSQQESQSPDSDEAGMSDETELYESDGDETRGPPVHGPPCSNLHCIKTTCADCGVVFEYNSPLAESSKRIVRCGACFDKFVQAEYVELIHDNQDSGHEERKRANAKRDSKGKKKRTQRTSCKHCGSTSHTRLCKSCPKHPDYVGKPVDTDDPVEPATRPTAKPAKTATRPTAKPAKPAEPTAKPAQPVAESAQPVAEPAQSAQPVAESAQSAQPVAESAEPTAQPAAMSPVGSVRADCTTPPPAHIRPVCPIGATVNAKWKDGHFYSAQIMTHRRDGMYDVSICCLRVCLRLFLPTHPLTPQVYFPDDGEKLSVRPCDVRLPLMKPSLTRDETIDKEFYDDGGGDFVPGTWVVLELNKKNNTQFMCKRMTGGDQVGEVIEHDIGAVMRKVRLTYEKKRED